MIFVTENYKFSWNQNENIDVLFLGISPKYNVVNRLYR